jgi:ribulose 1,5-bisphosphate carboxylase large subunit-like protein
LLITGQANSAFLADFVLHWAATTLKGLVQFQNKNSRPLFTTIFKPKIVISKAESLDNL